MSYPLNISSRRGERAGAVSRSGARVHPRRAPGAGPTEGEEGRGAVPAIFGADDALQAADGPSAAAAA